MSATPVYVAIEHTAVLAGLKPEDRATIGRFGRKAVHEVEAAVMGAVVACYRQMRTPKAGRKAI